MGKMGRVVIGGAQSNNTVYLMPRGDKKIPAKDPKVLKTPPMPVSTVPASSLPSSKITTPPATDSPTVTNDPDIAAKAVRREKIKNLVADVIVVLGLLLLSVGVCVLAAHAIGGISIDSGQMQTVIMCGFGLVAGGLSLPTTDYKGNVSVGGGALPFRFDLQMDKK